MTVSYEWRGRFDNIGVNLLHADFEDHLRGFYFDTCGFRPTAAGLVAL